MGIYQGENDEELGKQELPQGHDGWRSGLGHHSGQTHHLCRPEPVLRLDGVGVRMG